MDRTKQPEAEQEQQSWPAWFYGPDYQSQIFQNEDEVPEGWEDHPSKVGKSASRSSTNDTDAGSDIADDDDNVTALMEKTKDELLGILAEGKKDDDDVEYLESWPKLKLAKAIVAYDLVPEED